MDVNEDLSRNVRVHCMGNRRNVILCLYFKKLVVLVIEGHDTDYDVLDGSSLNGLATL